MKPRPFAGVPDPELVRMLAVCKTIAKHTDGRADDAELHATSEREAKQIMQEQAMRIIDSKNLRDPKFAPGEACGNCGGLSHRTSECQL